MADERPQTLTHGYGAPKSPRPPLWRNPGRSGGESTDCVAEPTQNGQVRQKRSADTIGSRSTPGSPALVRTVDAPRMVGDNTRLRERTGWSPEFTLAQTLADVLAAARQAVAAEPAG